MRKNLNRDFRNFYLADVSKRVVCPRCSKDAKVIVPAVTLTYIVHAQDKICVVDNQPVVNDG